MLFGQRKLVRFSIDEAIGLCEEMDMRGPDRPEEQYCGDNCGNEIVGARDDNKNCEAEICGDPDSHESEMVGASVGDDSQNSGARICSDPANCGEGIVGARDDNKNCEDEICGDPDNHEDEMVGANF